jgi:hypothetical protein
MSPQPSVCVTSLGGPGSEVLFAGSDPLLHCKFLWHLGKIFNMCNDKFFEVRPVFKSQRMYDTGVVPNLPQTSVSLSINRGLISHEINCAKDSIQ